ncbi:MAG: hypothetical protein ABIM74_01510 [candidate division WOR-3 bacterium]
MFKDRYFQVFLVLLCAWFVFQMLTIGFWPLPDLDGDEAWFASLATGLLRYGLCKSALLAGSSLESRGMGITSFWVYAGILAGFIKLIGTNLIALRLPSLIASVLVVFTGFWLASSLVDRKVGLLSGCALMLSAPFAGLSHYGRPEVLVSLGFVGIATLCLSEPQRAWRSFLGGFLGIALFLVYPLGPAAGLAALVLPLFAWRPRLFLWAALGFVAGSALIFFTNILPFLGQSPFSDVHAHYGMQFIPGLLFKNPLVVPVKWLKRIATEIPSQVIPMYGFWTPVVAAMGLGGLLLGRMRRLGVFFLLLILASAFWFPRFRYSYFVMFLPFLAIGFGALMAQLGPRLRWVLLAALLVPEMYYAQREIRLACGQASAQARVYREVAKAIPKDAKALGTSTRFFWPLGERYGFPASPEYVSGRITLAELMRSRGAEYLIVEKHDYPALPIEERERANPNANQNFAKSMDVFEADLLSDTGAFVLVKSIPGGYLDVREVAIYRLR